jgi:hypothetical protein
MNPTHLEYQRHDQGYVKVLGRYYNSEYKEPMGLLLVDDIPDDQVPELTKETVIV